MLPYQHQLFFAGSELEDGHILSGFSVGNGDTLHLLPKLPGAQMQVFVKTLKGKTIEQGIIDSAIFQMTIQGISSDHQRLFSTGKLFNNTPNLTIRCRGHIQILIMTIIGRTITLEVVVIGTIESVKASIWDKGGISQDQQQQIVIKKLSDTLDDNNIQKKDTVYAVGDGTDGSDHIVLHVR